MLYVRPWVFIFADNYNTRIFKGRYHSEDLSVDDRIKLGKILGNQGGKLWTESIWLKTGTRVRLL